MPLRFCSVFSTSIFHKVVWATRDPRLEVYVYIIKNSKQKNCSLLINIKELLYISQKS